MKYRYTPRSIGVEPIDLIAPVVMWLCVYLTTKILRPSGDGRNP